MLVCVCVAFTHSNYLNVWPPTGVAQDLCFQTPAAFTVFTFFLHLVTLLWKVCKKGEREIR